MLKIIRLFIVSILFIFASCGGGGGGSSTPTTPANAIPSASSANFSLDEDTTLTDNLVGSDADGDSLSFSVFANAGNGQVDINADGSFTYTPNLDFNGDDSFQFRVSDGTANSTAATVSLNINQVNDAPVAKDSMFSHDEDTILSESVDAEDVDGDSLTVEIINAPVNGEITQISGTNFEFTPVADYFGTDQFTFRVTDGELESDTQTVDIEIISVNDAPRISFPTNMTINEGGKFDVVITIIDIDGTITNQQVAGADVRAISSMYLETDTNFRFVARSRLVATDHVYTIFAIDNENARTDETFTFSVPAGTDADNDEITDFNDYDDDNDGYSDYYETTLGTNPKDKSSVPVQTPSAAGIDFSLDSDGDSVSDAQEISANYDPKNPDFYPGYIFDIAEILEPFAASDNARSMTLALAPVALSYDFSSGELPIDFNYTIADTQNNVVDAVIYLAGVSGQTYTTKMTLPFTDLAIGGTHTFDSSITKYLENDEFESTICSVDSLGNGLSPFGTGEINAICPSPVFTIKTVISGNAPANIDKQVPVLTQFDLPSTLDLDNGETTISIPVIATDSGIGISEISVILRPKGWGNISGYQTDEFVTLRKVFDTQVSVNDVLVSEPVSQFIRDGIWQVDSVLIFDALGNTKTYNTDVNGISELDTDGFNSEINIINSNADSTSPVYGALTLLTPVINLNDSNPVINFNITGSDSESGVSKIDVAYSYDESSVSPENLPNVVYIPEETVVLGAPQNTLDYTHTSVVVPQDTTLGTHFIELVLFDQAGNFTQNPNPMSVSVEVVRE